MKHSRHLCIGPGGRKCICCFPAPGSKDRKLQYRAAKRKDKKEAVKIEMSQIIDRGPVNFNKFEG